MTSETWFPFSPPWWQCCISHPDARDKVLAGREGDILFDFERDGRGWRQFRTAIGPDLEGGLEFLSQSLLSPRVPLVSTRLAAPGLELEWELVASAPDGGLEAPYPLLRQGGGETITGWDGPRIPRTRRDFVAAADCPPEFRDTDWAENGRAIVYEWTVPPGLRGTLVAGFAEGAEREPGRRLLRIDADGTAPVELDPAALFGFGRPGLVRLEVHDVDLDGCIRLRVEAARGSVVRGAFLSALWGFHGKAPSDDEILSGAAAPAVFANGGHGIPPPSRFLARLAARNTGSAETRVSPFLRVRTLERAAWRDAEVHAGPATRVRAHTGFSGMPRSIGGGLRAELPGMLLVPGESCEWFLTIDRHGRQGDPAGPATWHRERSRAVAFWEQAPLPYGILQIPEPRIQALLDSSVRNIYQARDIENELPAFHVGPTCYRQLWIVDGAFLLETATILGRTHEARAGLDYMLGFQEEDGGFQLKARYWKEAGIVLWAVGRHARLSRDREWLRSVWPCVVRAVDFLRRLRASEEAGDPASPAYRLAPHGDIDGGISNMAEGERFPEFSNPYWILVGLKSAAEAAAFLGEPAAEAEWRAEFEDFLSVFRATSRRHMRSDSQGNPYLPIRTGGVDPPQKGQWAFCHAVHPGGVFPKGDAFADGMLAMLDATRVEGLVFDTGWMPGGLWTYFASFLGHAHLWQGNPGAALADLRAMADHAAPILAWREEQKPRGAGTEEVGDMPHNWASAEFIRLAFHLVAMERGNELHLLHGVPREWLAGGNGIAVQEASTVFGPLSLELRPQGGGFRLDIQPVGGGCAQLVVHRTAWEPGGLPWRLDPAAPHSITVLKPQTCP
jgi:hypothetical protein